MKDYQRLYKDIQNEHKELKQIARQAITHACYHCRNTVDGWVIFDDVCKRCNVNKLLQLIEN